MKYFRKLSDILINSNILIACAAIFQCVLTYLILDNEVNYYILIIEGTSTLLLYNFSLVASKPKKPELSPFYRTRWFFLNIKYIYSISFIALVFLLYSLMHIHYQTLIYLSGIGVLSLLYGLPIFKLNGKNVGLRQFPALKVFYISLLWSLSGVGLPIVEMFFNNVSINWYVANYLGISKILFLVICTLPFDIRDVKSDRHYGLKTIPILIGEYSSKRLCYVLLLIHTVSVAFSPYIFEIKLGLLFVNFLVFCILKFIVFAIKESYTSVYMLDFVLVLQCLIVWLFILIS